MLRRINARWLALALLLALPGVAGAQSVGGSPYVQYFPASGGGVTGLTSDGTTVTSTLPVALPQGGAKDAVVRVFVTCETIAGITTADTKARAVKPGEGWGLTFSREDIPASFGTCTRDASQGFGQIGFAYVAAGAGQTTSIRWFATGGGLP